MNDVAVAVHARLAADPAVAALVGARIHPVRAPQDVTAPYVTFQRTSTQRFPTLDDAAGLAQARIEVSGWAEGFSQAREVASAARRALHGFAGWIAGVDVRACRCDGERDDHSDEAGLYRAALEFIITYAEPI